MQDNLNYVLTITTVSDCTSIISAGTGTITTSRYYYHTNHLGSVIALSNSSGTVVQNYSYDAFGKLYIVNGSGITSLDSYGGNLYSNTRLYTGREYDREINLYFLKARYYNPETGRFMSRDPIGQNDQINLYTYVRSSPLNFTDRYGMKGKPAIPNNSQEHYARNDLNTDLPKNYDAALSQKWIPLDESESVFHKFGVPKGKSNLKFTSPDGHKEAVYRYDTLELETDPVNMGTYNYYPPSDISNHTFYDVLPYYEYGNSENDYTTKSQRIFKSNDSLYTTYVKQKEIEHKVQKMNQADFVLSIIKGFTK